MMEGVGREYIESEHWGGVVEGCREQSFLSVPLIFSNFYIYLKTPIFCW